MIPDMSQLRTTGDAQTVAVKNKVLKNTYMLLSASMVPTVAGAWLGIKSGFSLFAGSPLISMLLFWELPLDSSMQLRNSKTVKLESIFY